MRSLLYKYFDSNGIRVRSLVEITFSFNSEVRQNVKHVYEPVEPILGIPVEELKQYIVDYIYETTNVDIGTIDNIERFQTLNGLPFLLKLYDGDTNSCLFSLAFGHIKGSVTIRKEFDVLSLGNIETIDGDLGFIESKVSSLGKLKSVGGSFWVAQRAPFTNLKDLCLLEYVGGDLNLKSTPVKDLKYLEKIGGTLNLRKTNIESFGNLKYVGNHIYLPTSLKESLDLSKIEIKGKVKYFKG